MYLAHTENINGEVHILKDHSVEVGKLASEFSEDVNIELKEDADWAGKIHDIGKYRDPFQDYLLGKRPGGEETHHAVYGAGLALEHQWLHLAFAIAGHHAGLHDLCQLKELVNKPGYSMKENLPLIKARFESEIGVIPKTLAMPFITKSGRDKLKIEFATRMLFSMLVDADFLDTETHYQAKPRIKVPRLDITELLTRLQKAKEKKSLLAQKLGKDIQLLELRNSIYQQCLKSAEKELGFFSLTVPTGGGKTLSGMAFALQHAAVHNLRRIIVVIPYLSIIEQNATEYRQILDPNREGIVIENHSSVVIPTEVAEEKEKTEAKRRSPLVLAAENWDAPIIVTTAVQFIESLFSNRPSRCRKLHNIANSVVLFDEVQTLPPHLLEPLFNVLRGLKENYRVSFVFSSATQPAFREQYNLKNGFKKTEIQEIVDNPTNLFEKLRRVSFEINQEEKITWANLASQILKQEQVLCILNTRKQAFALWNTLQTQLKDEEEKLSLFHLSSAMCAEHRLNTIGEVNEPNSKSIRWRLKEGLKCIVVSTQLVEAGVDLDFPIVFRAMGPLDSIVQAAGRCNRENNLTDKQGNKILGRVIVFRPEEDIVPRGIYSAATQQSAILLRKITEEALATNPEIFTSYFTRLYGSTQTDYTKTGERTIQQEREAFNFRSVSQKVKVIDDAGIGVIVPYANSLKIVEQIRNRPQIADIPQFSRSDFRRLQRFIVNVRDNNFSVLKEMGQVQPLVPNSKIELYVLNEASYHSQLGILIENRPTEENIL